MNLRLRHAAVCAVLFPLFPRAFSQGLDPAALLKQPTDTWPTYNGDYSGRRFSPLTQINSTNVHTLSLAWVARFTGAVPAAGGRGGAAAPAAPAAEGAPAPPVTP